MEHNELVEKLRLELRRGALPLAVLAQLREEHYGYSLRKAIAARGIDIDEGTLYPLVRRLASRELLLSEWRVEDRRKKRYYRLSPLGEQVLESLIEEWRALNAGVDHILEND